jgi:hypothetical protein
MSKFKKRFILTLFCIPLGFTILRELAFKELSDQKIISHLSFTGDIRFRAPYGIIKHKNIKFKGEIVESKYVPFLTVYTFLSRYFRKSSSLYYEFNDVSKIWMKKELLNNQLGHFNKVNIADLSFKKDQEQIEYYTNVLTSIIDISKFYTNQDNFITFELPDIYESGPRFNEYVIDNGGIAVYYGNLFVSRVITPMGAFYTGNNCYSSGKEKVVDFVKQTYGIQIIQEGNLYRSFDHIGSLETNPRTREKLPQAILRDDSTTDSERKKWKQFWMKYRDLIFIKASDNFK